MNYCYRTATDHRPRGIVEVYLNLVLMHVTGLYHTQRETGDGRDDHVNDLETLGDLDPFAASIKRMIRSEGWVALKDKTLYKTLFLALICGNLESVHAAADAIKTGSLPLPIQPMAVLAIQRASPSILTFCTQNGALWDPDTKKAWNGVSPIYGKAIQCDESWGERVICANGINTDYNIKKAMNAVYGERDSGSPEDGLGSKEQREGMERVMPPGWRDEICVVGFEERVREDEREIERGSWEFGNPVQPEGEDWYS